MLIIIKKCILTGAMAVILPGSPAQLVIAILIVFIDLLFTMKLEPFQDNTDDLLAFITSLQMVLTLLLALTKCVYDSRIPQGGDGANVDGPIGFVMTVLNMLAFIFFLLSVVLLHPHVRQCLEKKGSVKSLNKSISEGKVSSLVKVAPEGNRQANNGETTEGNTGQVNVDGENKQHELRSWGGS